MSLDLFLFPPFEAFQPRKEGYFLLPQAAKKT